MAMESREPRGITCKSVRKKISVQMLNFLPESPESTPVTPTPESINLETDNTDSLKKCGNSDGVSDEKIRQFIGSFKSSI